jgi:hypothetical protein
MRRFSLFAAVLVAFVTGSATAAGYSLQPIGNFERPDYVTSSPADPDRLLVAEREGKVFEVSGGVTRQIADLSALITCCESERGLDSIALAPDFESSARFYVAYTGSVDAGGAEGDVHLDSFRPDPAAPGTLLREPILSLDHAAELNHNAGSLQFGPDGKLYVAVGDGGGAGDPSANAQNTEVLFGKILRIDPRPGQMPPYTSPVDNPFFGVAGRDEIWAYGLRNAWRFSFDRLSGDMIIGDVGQGSREEVDFASSPGGGVVGGAGANYGWNCREGLLAYSDPAEACQTAGSFSDPVFDYVHQNPADGAAFGCSIIGGYVVRDRSLGDLYGRYVYADYCVGRIRSLLLPGATSGVASDDRFDGIVVPKPTSFGEDSCGRLYVASEGGTVYRLVGSMPAVCGPMSAPGLPTAAGSDTARRSHLRLRAKGAGRRLKIVAQVSPCAEYAGQRVRLNRGGNQVGAKRLNGRCTARFHARIEEAATFRALLPGSPSIRSQQLSVEPPHPRDRR